MGSSTSSSCGDLHINCALYDGVTGLCVSVGAFSLHVHVLKEDTENRKGQLDTKVHPVRHSLTEFKKEERISGGKAKSLFSVRKKVKGENVQQKGRKEYYMQSPQGQTEHTRLNCKSWVLSLKRLLLGSDLPWMFYSPSNHFNL